MQMMMNSRYERLLLKNCLEVKELCNFQMDFKAPQFNETNFGRAADVLYTNKILNSMHWLKPQNLHQ